MFNDLATRSARYCLRALPCSFLSCLILSVFKLVCRPKFSLLRCGARTVLLYFIRLRSSLRDGTETSSTHYAPPLVISSSCRPTVWTHVAFGRSLYSARDCGTLYLEYCLTLATALLALDILKTFFSLIVLVHTAH